MKKRAKSHKQWLRFPLYVLILAFLFFPGEGPVLPLLEEGKHQMNLIFTRKDIQTIFYALEDHFKKEGSYPARENFDLWMWERFRGDFSMQIPLDRWGEPLIYRTTPDRDGFRLACRGKDKIAGTADDFGIEVFYSQPRTPSP